MQEDNVFVQSENEQSIAPIEYDRGCNGHFRSIQVGGNGHYQGDRCGCDGQPSVSINNYIPILLIVALISIIKIYRNKYYGKY